MNFRLMTYNTLNGGKGREELITEVIRANNPDVVILQELDGPVLLEALARQLDMHSFFAKANLQVLVDRRNFRIAAHNVGLLSRYPIVSSHSYRSFPLRRTLLEATIEYAPGQRLALYGVHLKAILLIGAEIWRLGEISLILRRIKKRQVDKCIVAGDFNTVAKGDHPNIHEFPKPMQTALKWQLGKIYRFAIPRLVKAGFTDCYRKLHPAEHGFTLPTPRPNTRLDYIFVSSALVPALRTCEVITTPEGVHKASDHYPVIAIFEI
jgi:endonuclease/exonuclease/phosphatase family metal-dependent hydrolase